MFTVELTFRGDLDLFLTRPCRGGGIVRRELAEKTALKDVFEACGVPHPEVDLIVVDGAPADFAAHLERSARIEVHGVPAPHELHPRAPRLQTRRFERFIADGHLGTLARNLRLLGIDTAYERDADDRRLLQIMQAEDRALLTRDRRLLMHSIVRHGYCPRSSEGETQTREVLRRFRLVDPPALLAPYHRCLRCNGPVESVPKSDVLAPLADEPLTLRYYEEFRRCKQCESIYWPGTHFEKLAARIQRLLA